MTGIAINDRIQRLRRRKSGTEDHMRVCPPVLAAMLINFHTDASRPSPPGICRSMMMRSWRFSRKLATASFPLET